MIVQLRGLKGPTAAQKKAARKKAANAKLKVHTMMEIMIVVCR